ncbi:hypothetical protein JZ751_012313 [Albula glossodonta]|uniref:Uncharacterized protein n=1 Tax=Albula glossodonta TaxID=121402 RepID=A0A8T2PSA2_9TELE|nr:hypothetical protein JZ751_012313 [Albula glossodonta]
MKFWPLYLREINFYPKEFPRNRNTEYTRSLALFGSQTRADNVSLRWRISQVKYGKGRCALFPESPVNPFRVLADFFIILCAIYREERVRELRIGDSR